MPEDHCIRKTSDVEVIVQNLKKCELFSILKSDEIFESDHQDKASLIIVSLGSGN